MSGLQGWAPFLITLISAIFGGTGLFTYRQARRQTEAVTGKTEAEQEKAKAEASKIYQEMSLSLVTPLREQIEYLVNENKKNKARLAHLESRHDADLERIERLEEDRNTLASAVQEQVEWQQIGAPPPPPGFPARVLALLAKLHTT